MPRTCTICAHDEGHVINVELVQRTPYRDIARRYGVSKAALQRHAAEHLPQLLVKARAAVEVHQALDVVEQLRAINGASLAILKEARDAREAGLVLRAVDRVHRQIELQARLLGDIKEGATVNIHLHPEWVELRTLIVRALEPYEEARTAVLRAIQGGPSNAA